MFTSTVNIDTLVNVTLALITFSLGLTLTKQNFANLLVNPKSLTIGLFSQIILLPMAAVLIMYFTDISPVLKVGFFIIAICPSGISSNLLSFLMNGNTALSISMTVFNAIITLITVPVFTNLALDFFLHEHAVAFKLQFWDTFLIIFFVTVLPTIIGVMVRAKFKTIAKRAKPILRYILPILLLFIFSVKILADKESGGTKISSEEFLLMLLPGLLINFVGMLFGFIVGALVNVNFRNRLTILIEVGLQNTAMALLIAGTLINNTDMEKPALVYASFSFFSTFVFAWLFKYMYYSWKKWMKRIRHQA
ncbi:MAG: hypothetical protein LC109_05775 [Bacteroidia bacterium]|nr:hypothetical protein [Bacteroidia bacterium]